MQLVTDSYHLLAFIRPIHYKGAGGRNSSYWLYSGPTKIISFQHKAPIRTGLSAGRGNSYSSKISLFPLCSSLFNLSASRAYSKRGRDSQSGLKDNSFPYFLLYKPQFCFLYLFPLPSHLLILRGSNRYCTK